MKKTLLIVLATLMIPLCASAQRTVHGTFTLGANYFYTLSSHGAAINGGYNLSFGYVDAGISGTLRNHTVGADGTARSLQLMFNGGYMFRVAGTRTRNLNFYLGAGVLLGEELLKIDDSTMMLISSMSETAFKPNVFQVGAYPKASLEWYVTRSFAFELIARAPILFMGQTGIFFFEGGLGVKYNF